MGAWAPAPYRELGSDWDKVHQREHPRVLAEPSEVCHASAQVTAQPQPQWVPCGELLWEERARDCRVGELIDHEDIRGLNYAAPDLEDVGVPGGVLQRCETARALGDLEQGRQVQAAAGVLDDHAIPHPEPGLVAVAPKSGGEDLE